MSTQSRDHAYWHEVGADWLLTARHALWRSHHERVVGQWLARHWALAPGGRLLKTDLFEEAIGESPLPPARGARRVGVDISASVAAGAVRRGWGNALLADVRCPPFAPASFDVIVSTSTLDHFASAAELQQALERLVALLRRGGQLLITLDNLSNPLVRLRNALPGGALRRVGLVPYRVGASCDRAGMRRLLEGFNLEVRELTAILHCPRAPMVQLARLVEAGVPRAANVLRGALEPWELLERLPSRFISGYYLAAAAIKREG